ncbi:MAG TPA: asparagine synthase (glutamine-hydrolyzing) [Firmicutes bacterium]|nr:asparagine synthase (glutamine-hydrolyzing) [Bacillota bacterium]
MCGILGIVNYKSGDRARFSRSLDLLQHRGPDDSGTLEFPEILLGHRRLSVIDLDSGRQPISSEDGRFHIIFNGEIYNFKEIKKNLEECSYAFRTRSDTEVLLYGYIEYKEKILTRLNGMFSFAVWDDKDKELFLARDSLGQKPLFYAETGDGRFIFSSELNPMINLIPSLNELDMNAMFLYLCFQSVPAPYSIFKKVRRLVPGYYLKFRNRNSELSEYFRFNSFNEKVEREFSELKGGFWAVAEESVKRSLVADVPVGVFLSGGIDSTVITAALHRLGHEKIRTFSVGFKKAVNNEFEFSRMVSKKFRTEHTEILLEPLSMDVINNLVLHFGEPYADTSAIPTYYISNAVKNEIKVVLGGDGGDEMFAGYSTV